MAPSLMKAAHGFDPPGWPRFVGHVPLIRLRSPRPVPLDIGSLRSIPFEEWQAFADAFPFRGSSYESTAPVCFEVAIGTDPSATNDVDGLVEALMTRQDVGSAARTAVYASLLLVTAARLPRPALSIAYLRIDAGQALAMAGACQHELILFGGEHPVLELDEENVGPVREALDLVTARGMPSRV